MPKQLTPPITRTYVYGAMLLGALVFVVVMTTLIRMGDTLGAMRWFGAVFVLGCVQTVLAGCNQQFYFRHQRRIRKDDAKRAQYNSIISEAERFKREG